MTCTVPRSPWQGGMHALGGGTPIWKGWGCSLKILNLFKPLKETNLGKAQPILTPKRDHLNFDYMNRVNEMNLKYRKIPKISPRAYIFQRPFFMGLFLERPIFRGAYAWREICVIKLVGLDCSGKEIYHFCFVLLCIQAQIPSTSPPEGLIFGGAIWRRVFCITILGVLYYFGGAYTWRGLYYRNFTVHQFFISSCATLKETFMAKYNGVLPRKT